MTNNDTKNITIEQNERLRALYHLAVDLSAQHNLKSVLKTALTQCLNLTNSQFGFIGLTTQEKNAMDVVEVQGFHAPQSFYNNFRLIPLHPNIFSQVVLENKIIRTDSISTYPNRVGQPSGHPPVTSFLGLPLLIQEQSIGMIGLANRPTPYEEEHEHLVATYAAQIAIIIHNAQLYEELSSAKENLEIQVEYRTRELNQAKEALAQKAEKLQQLFYETVDIQEQERHRISQDMHDGMSQLLIGAMLELKSARQRIHSGDLEIADDALNSVHEILHDIEAETKRIIFDLRPPTLDALGFVPAIRRYCAYFKQYTDIQCSFTVEGRPLRLPQRTELNIYRLLQEALQNAYTHAKPNSVDVNIEFCSDAIQLCIIDDGVGFDVKKIEIADTPHFGMTTMQERATSLQGKLSITTQPGEGTCIELYVPIEETP